MPWCGVTAVPIAIAPLAAVAVSTAHLLIWETSLALSLLGWPVACNSLAYRDAPWNAWTRRHAPTNSSKLYAKGKVMAAHCNVGSSQISHLS